MSRWTVVAVLAELTLLAGLLALVAGALGSSAGAVAAAGTVLVLLLAAPSLALLLWGRRRSQVQFMAALVGSIGGKMLIVGFSVLFVSQWTGWPVVPFIFGLMGGWIVSFAIQGAVLKLTLKPATVTGTER